MKIKVPLFLTYIISFPFLSFFADVYTHYFSNYKPYGLYENTVATQYYILFYREAIWDIFNVPC